MQYMPIWSVSICIAVHLMKSPHINSEFTTLIVYLWSHICCNNIENDSSGCRREENRVRSEPCKR